MMLKGKEKKRLPSLNRTPPWPVVGYHREVSQAEQPVQHTQVESVDDINAADVSLECQGN